MIIVTGGAYQGKLEYIKKEYALTDGDIHFCNGAPIDMNKKAIYGFQNHILSLVKSGVDVDVSSMRESLEDKIVVCDDISQGIVPTDSLLRKWREETGRVMSYLASDCDGLIRIFCGIPMVIK